MADKLIKLMQLANAVQAFNKTKTEAENKQKYNVFDDVQKTKDYETLRLAQEYQNRIDAIANLRDKLSKEDPDAVSTGGSWLTLNPGKHWHAGKSLEGSGENVTQGPMSIFDRYQNWKKGDSAKNRVKFESAIANLQQMIQSKSGGVEPVPGSRLSGQEAIMALETMPSLYDEPQAFSGHLESIDTKMSNEAASALMNLIRQYPGAKDYLNQTFGPITKVRKY